MSRLYQSKLQSFCAIFFCVFSLTLQAEMKPVKKPHVLVLNDFLGAWGQYKKWIPDTDYQVDYIVSDFGLAGIKENGMHEGSLVCTIHNSFSDDQVFRCVEDLQAAHGAFDYVVTLHEKLIEMTAEIRDKYHVPNGQKLSDALLFRDKLVMKERIADRGVPTAPFHAACFSSDQELQNFVAEIGTPIVLKPRLEMGAEGIEFLNSAELLQQKLKNPEFDCEEFLVEKYMSGDVYHVDGIVVDGQIVYQVASRYTRPVFDFYRQMKPLGDYTLLSEFGEILKGHSADVIEALEYRQGVFHLEFIADSQGEINFLEIAARFGGGLTTNRIRITFGVDLVEANVQTQMNMPVTSLQSDKKNRLMVAGDMEIPLRLGAGQKKCKITQSEFVADAQKPFRTMYWKHLPEVGTIINASDEMTSAQFLFQGKSEEEVVEEINRAMQTWSYKCEEVP